MSPSASASITQSAVRSAERILSAAATQAKLVSYIQSGQLTPPEIGALNLAKTVAVTHRWRSRGRQTMLMHPEVVREVRLATSTKVPVEIFRSLPYLNPMVIFPEPIFCGNPQIQFGGDLGNAGPAPYQQAGMRLVGFCVAAYHASESEQITALADLKKTDPREIVRLIDAVVTDTHDPDAGRLLIEAYFDIYDAAGKSVDLETSSYSFDLHQIGTLAELAEDQYSRTSAVARNDGGTKWVADVLKTILGSMFYLCSTTLDAEKVPATATRHLARGIARKPLSLYRIGWTTGAALTRLRQQRIGSTSEQSDLAHQQDPQHRRAHFKTVWTGKGSTIPKTVFIAPYWTHLERLGDTGVNTVRKVPRVAS